MEHPRRRWLDETHRAEMEAWGEQSSLSVPLFFQGEAIGTLTLVEKRVAGDSSPEEHEAARADWRSPPPSPSTTRACSAREASRTGASPRWWTRVGPSPRRWTWTSSCRPSRMRPARPSAPRSARSTPTTRETETLTVVAFYQRVPDARTSGWVGRRTRCADYPGDRATLYCGQIKRGDGLGPDARRRQPAVHDRERREDDPHRPARGRRRADRGARRSSRPSTSATSRARSARSRGRSASRRRIAMRNAQLLGRLEEQNRRLGSLLDSTTRHHVECRPRGRARRRWPRRRRVALDCQQCQIQEYDADANTVTVAAMYSASPDPAAFESLHETFSLDDEPEERGDHRGARSRSSRPSDPDVTPGAREVVREVRRQGVPQRAARVQRRAHRPARPHRDRA